MGHGVCVQLFTQIYRRGEVSEQGRGDKGIITVSSVKLPCNAAVVPTMRKYFAGGGTPCER